MSTKAGPSDNSPSNISNSVARASGYQNNCAFHCIALTWLNLPADKIKDLYKSYPIYQKIIKNFYGYYQLEGKPNLTDFLRMVGDFNHPFDKEVLVGPILRNVLQEEMVNEAFTINEITNGKTVPDDRVAILTKKMGANLIIHSDEKFGDVSPQTKYDISDPQWTVEISHENNHYNFSYGNLEKNRWHNDQYELNSENNRRLPKKNGAIPALLEDACDVVGIKEQKEAITQVVRAKHDEIKEHLLKKKDASFSPMASARKVVGFAMDVKSPTTPELIARTFSKNDNKLPKKSTITPKELNNAFEEKLKIVFPVSSWKHEITDERIKITSKTAERKVLVNKNLSGMHFSGSKNTENEIAQAANAYKEVCNDNHYKVVFEVSAQDETQALLFLKKLQENHFDIKQITGIHCKDKDLKGESLESFTQKLVTQAIHSSPGSASVRSSP